MINEHHIRGEKNTGYEDENGLGEFECENCKYFSWMTKIGACSQTEMLIYSRQPHLDSQHVIVDPEGCCEYVERIGRTDKDLTPEI